MLGNPRDGSNAQAVGHTLLAILADAGLDPDNAASASYLLYVLILGSVAFQQADHTQRADRRVSDAETERFLWGIDRLLDGLAAHAAIGTA